MFIIKIHRNVGIACTPDRNIFLYNNEARKTAKPQYGDEIVTSDTPQPDWLKLGTNMERQTNNLPHLFQVLFQVSREDRPFRGAETTLQSSR